MLILNASSFYRTPMSSSMLTALSPLDGRYAAKVEPLRSHFSEFGLFRNRIRVEIEWLKALAAAPEIAEVAAFSTATIAELDRAIAGFSVADAEAVKTIEARTNHDVKAVEYWLKDRFKSNPEVMRVAEFIHFACTSEDINNVSHALMLKEARDAHPAAGAGQRDRALPRTGPPAGRPADAVAHPRPAGQPDHAGQGDGQHRRAPDARPCAHCRR